MVGTKCRGTRPGPGVLVRLRAARIVGLVPALRRAAVALGVAGAVASVLRVVVSRQPQPAQSGGWRELSGPELS